MGRRAPTPSTCATSTSTSGAGPRGRSSITSPRNKTGIVCFITVAGFLNGPGFQKMRDYLRRTCDDIWVIDCSPEGHQPEVNTRIFQAVQQPVCIVLASRSAKSEPKRRPRCAFRLPAGHRDGEVRALGKLETRRHRRGSECPTDWRAPFLPASTGAWATYPALEDLFIYNGSGVMPGRTWVIAPDAESLERRWQKLMQPAEEKEEAISSASSAAGSWATGTCERVVKKGSPVSQANRKPVADERAAAFAPVRYGFRSFDRQWIIPDNRVINQPNPELWSMRSDRQVYLTALSDHRPLRAGAHVHRLCSRSSSLQGSFGGRVFPLWRDAEATIPNMPPKLLAFLAQEYGQTSAPRIWSPTSPRWRRILHSRRVFRTISRRRGCGFRSPLSGRLSPRRPSSGARSSGSILSASA